MIVIMMIDNRFPMIPCTCEELCGWERGKKGMKIDSIVLESYRFTAHNTKGDGDCALHALFPGRDVIFLRKKFTEYLW